VELFYGAYTLDPAYAYLPPSTLLFLLSILSFLVRKETRKFTQKHHSFPAVGFTSFLGGAIFLLCHLLNVKQGQTLIILGILTLLLIVAWIAARVLRPAPVKKLRVIKPKGRYEKEAINQQKGKPAPLSDIAALDELDIFIGEEGKTDEQ